MIEILVCDNCNSGVGVYNDYIQRNILALTEELKNIGNQVKKMKATIDGMVDVGDIRK